MSPVADQGKPVADTRSSMGSGEASVNLRATKKIAAADFAVKTGATSSGRGDVSA
jgi:hypothetical protein